MKYVGHIVSESGVETDPEKVDKVINWPIPSTPEDVRRFIGFAGYYRRFIKNFSQISRPLTKNKHEKDKETDQTENLGVGK